MSVADTAENNLPIKRPRVDGLMIRFEHWLYNIAFFLLIAAAALVLFGIVPAVINSLRQNEDTLLDSGILAVDRVLIIIIIAELGSTLRTVRDQEIIAEPFLLIGLIAIIRRILILSAELEQGPSGERVRQLLFELGGLSLMILAIGTTILLLRNSAHRSILPYLRRRAGVAVDHTT
ncbi:MAG TPA: phosphate-starvation-inducible PsiE family protein [Mycobacterium sp.]|nr:phosphate-starvation-inducible PsiE family protein [Mycobacterium sp.]